MKQMCLLVFLMLLLGARADQAQSPVASPDKTRRDSLLAVLQHARPGRAHVQALLQLSECYRADSSQALFYAEEAVAMARQQGLDTLVAVATHGIARVLFNHSRYSLARAYYARAFKEYRVLGMRKEMASSQRGVSNACHHSLDGPAALRAGQTALKLAKLAGDQEEIIKAHLCIGSAFSLQEENTQALTYLLEGLQLTESYRLTTTTPLFLNNIAVLYQEEENYEQARYYYKRALALHRKAQDLPNQVLALGNLGIVYTKEGNYPLAQHYLQAGLTLQQRVPGFLERKHLLLYTLGEVALKQGNNRQALHYLELDETLLKKLNQNYQQFPMWLRKAEAYLNLGDYAAGVLAARQAQVLAKQCGLGGQDLMENYDVLARLSAAQGRYKAAYEYRELHRTYQDSVLRQDKVQQTAELLARYESGKKEAQIQLLRRNATLQRRELLWQQRFRNALGGGLLASLLLGGSWYRRLRREQQAKRLLLARENDLATANTDLTRAQQQLQQSLGEKEVLLREVHHRVKNNLQIIYGLLVLQTRRQSLPLVINVLREVQNWVKSIALTHEMLYQAADLVHIEFQPLLEQLTHLLRRPLESGPPVHYTVRAMGVHLNASTAVPLALLTNELLTNAYTHAFPSGRAGAVCIDLRATSPGCYTLRVADNGAGLPPDLDWQHTTSLGLRLVRSLARQLQGTVQVQSSAEGTTFVLAFAEVTETSLPV